MELELNSVEREKELVLAALDQAGGNKRGAARLLGINRSTVYAKIKRLGIKPGDKIEKQGGHGQPEPPPKPSPVIRYTDVLSEGDTEASEAADDDDVVYDPEADEEDIDILIDRKTRRYIAERDRHADKKLEIPLPAGPFGLMCFGDPHLDSPSCNWLELRKAIEVASRHPAMRAICVGDIRNNWVGSLLANYAKQETTDTQSVRLARWFAHSLPWDALILGNHDNWRDGKLLMGHVFRGAKIRAMEPYESRIIYRWPGGQEYLVEVRHDFKGRSIWNPTHGGGREAKLDSWADLYVSGHLHVPAVHEEEWLDNRWKTVFLLSSFDGWAGDYAQKMQLRHRLYGSTVTAVIDPDAYPPERCRRFLDPELAADYLTWVRSRG